MQACFTAFLRTFCARLKSQYGRDGRLGTKISQVEQFCAEVGQHLLVRPHTARSDLPGPAGLLDSEYTCTHGVLKPTNHGEPSVRPVLRAGLVSSKPKTGSRALRIRHEASALRPSSVLIRNRAVGAAVTALQQLEGAIQKAAARMEESSRGPISLEVGPCTSIRIGNVRLVCKSAGAL